MTALSDAITAIAQGSHRCQHLYGRLTPEGHWVSSCHLSEACS